MKLLNEFKLSEWAFDECYYKNDTKEIRDLITHPEWICNYCYHIRDIKEMWSKIKDPDWAINYCKNVKDRPEVRKYAGSKAFNQFVELDN